MDDVSDEASASFSQSFGMDKADIFFGRTLKLTLGWKIRSHRSENGKKIMGEDPQSLENHGFPQISQLVLPSFSITFLFSLFLYLLFDPYADPYGKFQRKGLEHFREDQRLPESTFPIVCAACL